MRCTGDMQESEGGEGEESGEDGLFACDLVMWRRRRRHWMAAII